MLKGNESEILRGVHLHAQTTVCEPKVSLERTYNLGWWIKCEVYIILDNRRGKGKGVGHYRGAVLKWAV